MKTIVCPDCGEKIHYFACPKCGKKIISIERAQQLVLNAMAKHDAKIPQRGGKAVCAARTGGEPPKVDPDLFYESRSRDTELIDFLELAFQKATTMDQPTEDKNVRLLGMIVRKWQRWLDEIW